MDDQSSITSYRQILFLPLIHSRPETIHAPDGNWLARKLGPNWQEEGDLLSHLTDDDVQARYEEFNYFHAFIQDFLFKHGEDRGQRPWPRGLRLFRRSDLTALEVDVRPKLLAPFTVRLTIDRLNLYAFDNGIAVAAIELMCRPAGAVRRGGSVSDLDLGHLMALQNAVRRIYPPYFTNKNAVLSVEQYPGAWRLYGKAPTDAQPQLTFVDHAEPAVCLARFGAREPQKRESPFASIWSNVLAPLDIDGSDGSGSWQQIVDERMPSMVFVGSPDAGKFSDGEWARLAFMDEPDVDRTTQLPKTPMGQAYSSKFMRCDGKGLTYDRHWYRDENDGPAYGTKYLFTSYSFLTVGTPSRSPDETFPRMIEGHFRRHYFQMGLLINFQVAALLALSARASNAVRDYPVDTDRRALRQQLSRIRGAFLTLSARIGGPQISGQLQGREMYAMWRKATDLDALYSHVQTQLSEAADHLETAEQAASTEASTQLAVVATFGAVVGVAMATLAVFSEKWFKKFEFGFLTCDSLTAVATIGAVSWLAALVGRIAQPGGSKRVSLHRMEALLVALACAGLLAFGVRASITGCANKNDAPAVVTNQPGGPPAPLNPTDQKSQPDQARVKDAPETAPTGVK